MTWRLIHTNSDVIDLLETNDVTVTAYSIFESKTKEECLNNIDELKLTYYYPLNENEILFLAEELEQEPQ
jgi:hypothetical protein